VFTGADRPTVAASSRTSLLFYGIRVEDGKERMGYGGMRLARSGNGGRLIIYSAVLLERGWVGGWGLLPSAGWWKEGMGENPRSRGGRRADEFFFLVRFFLRLVPRFHLQRCFLVRFRFLRGGVSTTLHGRAPACVCW
jgi:hypothetical protein